MSSRLSPLPVPSFTWWRFNHPGPKVHFHHRPVAYASGVTKHHQRQMLLDRKRRAAAADKQWRATRDSVTAADAAIHSGRAATAAIVDCSAAGSGNGPGDTMAAVAGIPAAAVLNDAQAAALFQHCLRLTAAALPELAEPHVDRLAAQRWLTPEAWAVLIASLRADAAQMVLMAGRAEHDPALTMKLVADFAGDARAATAGEWLERCAAQFPVADGSPAAAVGARTGLSAAHYNAFMEVLLTCGFGSTERVHRAVYDAMGTTRVAPNAATYGHVMRSLCLTGNTAEAESVHAFLRHTAPAALHVSQWHSLLMGARQEKDFDKAAVLWQELIDTRAPAPDLLAAELYLRSIIDHSYTPATSNMTQYGQPNVGEKKKVPAVLRQMEALGLPWNALPAPVQDEVEDALRKYSIGKSRFYDWGRSVRQFAFVKFRQANAWTNDLQEVTPPVLTAPVLRPFGEKGPVAPAAASVGRLEDAMRPSWERPALADVMFKSEVIDMNGEARAGSKYHLDATPIHGRGPHWAAEVPQTRFDGLYGVSNPNLARIGIRRHMLAGEQADAGDLAAADARVARAALAGGRRARLQAEKARTHRNAAE